MRKQSLGSGKNWDPRSAPVERFRSGIEAQQTATGPVPLMLPFQSERQTGPNVSLPSNAALRRCRLVIASEPVGCAS
jgi:hypothetical protein